MATFLLRTDDDLMELIQAESLKQNRSINKYIVNLIQKDIDKETAENEISLTNKKLDDHINNFNLYCLQQAAMYKHNILICGDTATGKSLLLKKFKKVNDCLGFKSIYIVSNDFADFLTSFDLSKAENIYYRAFFDVNNAGFIYDFVHFAENNKHLKISYCLALPSHFDFQDNDIKSKFYDLIDSMMITSKNGKYVIENDACIKFSLDEILALSFKE